MLGFLNELQNLVKMPVERTIKSFKFVNLGNRAVFIQGKTKIHTFSTVKIILNMGREKVFIYGKNLSISHFSLDDIAIAGDIICVSKCEVEIGE